MHAAFEAFLARHDHRPAGSRPAAVFDCDGTIIRGDIGEAMFHRQVEEFWFRTSPAAVWPDHPRAGEIDRLYRELSLLPAPERRESGAFAPFADFLTSWYVGQIGDGLVAKACADIVRLFAGYTPDEVRALARSVWERELGAETGTRRLGSATVPTGVRYLKPALELFRELQNRRFDIWVISGSNRWSVEAVFAPLGVGTDRVIGIGLREEDGVFTGDVETPVPIRADKVAAFRLRRPDPPLLVASDSKNDIPLFLDAAELKVRINSRNRDTEDFFRAVGAPADDTWVLIEEPEIIEPMEFPWPTQR